MAGKNEFEVKGFNAGDNVVLVDDATKTRSHTGFIFQIDMGEVTVRVYGCQVTIDGGTLKGKTPFGSCTMVKA